MVYLLGVCHRVQTQPEGAGLYATTWHARFRSYVTDAVLANNVTTIAEETNDKIESAAGKSIARLVAESMSPPIQYIPCEPSIEERRALGIPNEDESEEAELLKYFAIREKFWIERLRKVLLDSILLVCGANHVPTFSCRLTDAGIPSHVVTFNWCDADEQEHGPLPWEGQA